MNYVVCFFLEEIKNIVVVNKRTYTFIFFPTQCVPVTLVSNLNAKSFNWVLKFATRRVLFEKLSTEQTEASFTLLLGYGVYSIRLSSSRMTTDINIKIKPPIYSQPLTLTLNII